MEYQPEYAPEITVQYTARPDGVEIETFLINGIEASAFMQDALFNFEHWEAEIEKFLREEGENNGY